MSGQLVGESTDLRFPIGITVIQKEYQDESVQSNNIRRRNEILNDSEIREITKSVYRYSPKKIIRDLRASENSTYAQRKEAVAKEKYLDQLKVKIKK